MVEEQLVRRGIRDPRVLDAMGEVPRERFVPPGLRHRAYADAALPAEEGQTISQPYVVARMLELLELSPGDRVLEIGAGTGFSAAVLSYLVDDVVTVERLPALVASARDRLEEMRIRTVEVVVGDGSVGWPDRAPYDAIVVTAGGPRVPDALRDQLAPGGRLVMPVGPRDDQRLVRVRREPDGWTEEALEEMRFIPLIGVEGWAPDE